MFEQDIKSRLTAIREPFTDNTRSLTALDFELTRHAIHFDAKEKRQPFSMKHWNEAPMPQEFLFIVDDLAVRKLLLYAPHSFTLIRDSSLSPAVYYVYSIVDFLCIPKHRVRRPIRKTVPTFKGKWLIDFRNAASFDELPEAIDYIIKYPRKENTIFRDHIDCWGKYHSEHIGKGGTTRLEKHWKEDAKSHS
ncbi:MAG: hypothetical protein ACKVRP_12120 [Bacteroidota bacterium]